MQSTPCASSPRRKCATPARCSGCLVSSSSSIPVNRIPERENHRFEDRYHRRQFFQISAIAIARAVVEFFGHLRVAGGARIAAVFVEVETALVERKPDKTHDLADIAFLVGDDVL